MCCLLTHPLVTLLVTKSLKPGRLTTMECHVGCWVCSTKNENSMNHIMIMIMYSRVHNYNECIICIAWKCIVGSLGCGSTWNKLKCTFRIIFNNIYVSIDHFCWHNDINYLESNNTTYTTQLLDSGWWKTELSYIYEISNYLRFVRQYGEMLNK